MGKTKKAIIVAAVLIVAGVVIAFTAIVMNGFRLPANVRVNIKDMTSEADSYVKKTEQISDNFRSVDIKGASFMDVAVKKTDESQSYVEYYDGDGLTHHIIVEDGVLKITVADNRSKAFNISIGFDMQQLTVITIYLAENEYDDISVVTSSGDIYMEYKITANNVSLNTSSGDVVVNGLNADSMTVETSSGEVELNLSPDRDYVYNISTNSGSVNVPQSEEGADGKCNIKTSSGDVNVTR